MKRYRTQRPRPLHAGQAGQAGMTQAGMTLLETLIVIAIAVAVIGGVIFIMQRQNERARNEEAVRFEGQEMSLLAKAARQYAATAGADWAEGDRVEVSLEDLVTAGLLPEDFAARGDGMVLGLTPIGQRYRVFSIKDGGLYDDPNVTNGKIRTVILDMEAPVVGRMERAGVVNVEAAILAFKEAIALWTTSEERVPMGVLESGAEAVRGVGRVFTKDVIDWINDPVTTPAVVALVGFPDLDGEDDTTVGPTGNTDTCEEISFLEEGLGCPGGPGSSGPSCAAGYEEPQCPAGMEEIASAHICTPGSTQTSPLLFSDPAGTVALGKEITTSSQPPGQVPYYYSCGAGTCTGFVRCGGYDSQTQEGYAQFNGAKIGVLRCLSTYSSTQIVYSGSFGVPPACTAGATSSTAYPTISVPGARSKVCCRRPANN